MSQSLLSQPLSLPNGAVIPNRIAKAAMDSNLCDADHAPGSRLIRLYQRWADGGAGLIVTGNVMIDRHALAGPGSVVLDSAAYLPRFAKWAAACRSNGAQAWLQLNHPGRQMLAAQGQIAWAPSAVSIDAGDSGIDYAPPQAMSVAQIHAVIAGFARSAQLAEAAGFSGVQIQAAQGHLLSQFLSPLCNRRDDEWGGNLEQRARLLLQTLRAVRQSVSPDFCLAVNLNCADFCAGGFELADAAWVVQQLNGMGVDLLEISGGNYENPAMLGLTADGCPLPQEVYFLDAAQALLRVAQMPLMLTGGIRRRAAAEQVVASGIAIAGVASALAMVPDLPQRWLAGAEQLVARPASPWSGGRLAAVATLMLYTERLGQLGAGKMPTGNLTLKLALLNSQVKIRQLTGSYRRWIASLSR